jgi:HSP20 family protein
MAAQPEPKTSAPANAEQRPARTRDPFDVLDILPREMVRMFGNAWPLLPPPIAHSLLSPPAAWTPRMDVYEKDGNLVVNAELPGVKSEDIQVTVQGKALIVAGERKTESEVKEEDNHRAERAYGRFYRYLPFDFEPDADKVQATFKDGALEVRIPKPTGQVSSGKSIPIQA